MANDYFDSGDYTGPDDHALARASSVRNLAAAVAAGFDRLPGEQQLKRGTVVGGADAGAANAYVVTLTHPAAAYVSLMEVAFIPANTNTGASTVNVDVLGAKTIKRASGADVQAGDLTAGSVVVLRYDGTAFRLVSPNLGSESAAAASAAAAAASAVTAAGHASAASGSASVAAGHASNADNSADAAAASAAAAAGATAAALAARTIATTGLAGGGGTLGSDRTIDVPVASKAEAEAGAINDKGMTPLRTAEAIAALAVPGITAASVEVFTSSGTSTKPAGAKLAKVTCIGAGGGTGANVGGGGAAAVSWLDASTLAGTITVTIGAAAGGTGASGDTSFGSHVIAKGANQQTAGAASASTGQMKYDGGWGHASLEPPARGAINGLGYGDFGRGNVAGWGGPTNGYCLVEWFT